MVSAILLASQPRLFSVGNVFSEQVAVRVGSIDRLFATAAMFPLVAIALKGPSNRLCDRSSEDLFFRKVGSSCSVEGSDPPKDA